MTFYSSVSPKIIHDLEKRSITLHILFSISNEICIVSVEQLPNESRKSL